VVSFCGPSFSPLIFSEGWHVTTFRSFFSPVVGMAGETVLIPLKYTCGVGVRPGPIRPPAYFFSPFSSSKVQGPLAAASLPFSFLLFSRRPALPFPRATCLVGNSRKSVLDVSDLSGSPLSSRTTFVSLQICRPLPH